MKKIALAISVILVLSTLAGCSSVKRENTKKEESKIETKDSVSIQQREKSEDKSKVGEEQEEQKETPKNNSVIDEETSNIWTVYIAEIEIKLGAIMSDYNNTRMAPPKDPQRAEIKLPPGKVYALEFLVSSNHCGEVKLYNNEAKDISVGKGTIIGIKINSADPRFKQGDAIVINEITLEKTTREDLEERFDFSPNDIIKAPGTNTLVMKHQIQSGISIEFVVDNRTNKVVGFDINIEK